MSEGPVILVIDDEAQIRKLFRLSLDAHGYHVVEADTAKEGIRQATASKPDLILLDLGLPDMDGLELLKSFREWTKVPVIILSVRNSEQDKITLLDAGANDYITKPFSIGELLARIRAALRHSLPETVEGILAIGNLVIDFSRRIVTKNGEEVKLTPTEYSLLRFLARNADKVITQSQIIHELWSSQAYPDTSYLRVFVLQLRRKIEDDPSNPKIILTEPGVGYRLITG
jgi:two-component system, OmpR family, KDP operon response regulator KdpE